MHTATRTLFLTCTLGLFLSAFVSAQTFEQLQNIINTNMQALPATQAELHNLRRVQPTSEMIGAGKAVAEAATQIRALPDLTEDNLRWTLRREAIALVVLVQVPAEIATYYPRLLLVADELAEKGLELANIVEPHILEVGALLATQVNAAMNINRESLAKRMVLYAEQHPGPASLRIIENFLDQIREMRNMFHRDRRLAEVAEIFQQYYYSIRHTEKARALDPDIMRSTLEGGRMTLRGVDLNGRDFDPASIEDKVVLLYFWTTGCVHCKQLIPDLIALHEKYYADGLRIIGINPGGRNDDERTVRNYIETETFGGKRIPWTILHEGLAERRNRERNRDLDTITKLYGIDRFPTSILIGRDGRVIRLHPSLDPPLVTLDGLIAEATSIFATIEFTEEEKRQIEEMERREREEIDRLLRRESPEQ